jgi:hypothetical protein
MTTTTAARPGRIFQSAFVASAAVGFLTLGAFPACSDKFSSCEAQRNCPSSGGTGGASGEPGGAGGEGAEPGGGGQLGTFMSGGNGGEGAGTLTAGTAGTGASDSGGTGGECPAVEAGAAIKETLQRRALAANHLPTPEAQLARRKGARNCPA